MGGREHSVPRMQDREEAVADQREQSIGGVAKRVWGGHYAGQLSGRIHGPPKQLRAQGRADAYGQAHQSRGGAGLLHLLGQLVQAAPD